MTTAAGPAEAGEFCRKSVLASAGGINVVAAPVAYRSQAATTVRRSATAARRVYGPFRVIDERRVRMIGVTGPISPVQFDAMMRDHPGIRVLELVEVAGTDDDTYNLRLGCLIRYYGLSTYVPSNGSVRSGGVELFLAGVRKEAAPGSEFVVHAWLDDAGRGPHDYPESYQGNAMYIAYYRDMGMSLQHARRFYAMTNAAPFNRPRSMSAAELEKWLVDRE